MSGSVVMVFQSVSGWRLLLKGCDHHADGNKPSKETRPSYRWATVALY
jgi:hypothetical protein